MRSRIRQKAISFGKYCVEDSSLEASSMTVIKLSNKCNRSVRRCVGHGAWVLSGAHNRTEMKRHVRAGVSLRCVSLRDKCCDSCVINAGLCHF